MKFYSFLLLSLLLACGCGILRKKSTCVDEPTQNLSVENLAGKIHITSVPKSGNFSVMEGNVKDFNSPDGLVGANVLLRSKEHKDGEAAKVFGASTDLEGNFSIQKIPAGDYDITISYVGYRSMSSNLKIEKTATFTLTATFERERPTVKKPVIYLYPTQKQQINVSLDFEGTLSHSYPAYPKEGWNVSAAPDGTLTDAKNQEYYALFWEGKPSKPIMPKEGFVVAGNATASFLEEKLAFLGLNRREANEFIMYWLPLMENNPYNLIYFAGKDYEKQAQLRITPKPETLIRVMMLTKALNAKIDFPMQDLSPLAKKRKGFTAVEWGGGLIQEAKQEN